MRFLIIVLLFISPAFGQQPQPQTCTPAADAQHTIWGNLPVHYDYEARRVKVVEGIVSFGSAVDISLAEGVLVEIYPYRAGDNTHIPERSRPRLRACVTGVNGAFKFDVPSGQYEIIVSKANYRATTYLLTVDRKKGKREALKIPLNPGI